MTDWFLSFAKSRKFWLTIVALGITTALYVRGEIHGEQFGLTAAALIAVLSAAIAHEDAAEKSSPPASSSVVLPGTYAATRIVAPASVDTPPESPAAKKEGAS